MASPGTVRLWQADEGWGVIDSPATPGGCWAHYSAVIVTGYRALTTGEAVSFTFELAEQDGYSFRAVEVRAGDRSPVRDTDEVAATSSAYRSTFTVTFDEEGEAGAS